MSHIVATQQLTFDDFLKNEYRAFKLEGQPDYISLPTLRDRLLDTLVAIERQMEQGDHLAITLSVSRPNPENDEGVFDMLTRHIRQQYYGTCP